MLTLAAAACIVTGSLVATTSAENPKDVERPSTVQPAAAPAIPLPAGFKAHANDDVADIRGSLITIVARTMTPEKLDTAVAYLASQDRERIKSDLPKKNPSIDGRVEQIRGIYKQKYGEDFELKTGALDSLTTIRQGEVEDQPAARQNWPVPLSTNGKPVTAIAKNDDPKLDNGREVALVRLAFNGKLPPITVSLQYELPDYWVVDVPNTVTSAELLKSEAESLQKLIEMQNDWPKTKEEAGQLIAYHVLHGYFGATDQPVVGAATD
jgi:hypothetical protein